MSQKKRKPRKMFLILLIITLLILPFQVYRLKNRLEFNRRVRALAAEGHPVSITDLQAAYVLPEGVDNAADVYQRAFDAYVEPNETEEEWLPIRGFYEPLEDEPPYPPEVMKAIKTSLASNRKCIELLDQAAQMEHCLFPRIPDNINCNCNYYCGPLKKLTRLLIERNLFYAQTEQTDKLFEAIQTCIELTDCMSKQPVLIDHLVTVGFKADFANSLESCLNLTSFSYEQLTVLQQVFRGMRMNNTETSALINDRGAEIHILRLPAKKMLDFHKFSTLEQILYIPYAFSGLIDKDWVLYLKFYEQWIEISKLPYREQLAKLNKMENDFESYCPLLHPGFWIILPSRKISKINLRVISQLQCAETALAVEQYRLKYHRLPESLDALVPEFIDTVYLDPFDGEPLRYQLREEGGYTIYCIGEDGVDNGGLDQEQLYIQSEGTVTDECDYPFTVKK